MATWIFIPVQLTLVAYGCYAANTLQLTDVELTGEYPSCSGVVISLSYSSIKKVISLSCMCAHGNETPSGVRIGQIMVSMLHHSGGREHELNAFGQCRTPVSHLCRGSLSPL